MRTLYNTELLWSRLRNSPWSSTCSWTSLAPLSVFCSSWIMSFSYSIVCWADRLILWCSWKSSQCCVVHWQPTIRMNINGWNTLDSILWIRTYINSSIILFPTILPSLLSSTLFRTIQSLCIVISSWVHLAMIWLVGIAFAGLITCWAIAFWVAPFISTKDVFQLCPSVNLKSFERLQLYEICPSMGSLIICLWGYNPLYSSSNSSCSKVNSNINDGMYGSFQPPLLLMISITSSPRLTYVYEAWR